MSVENHKHCQGTVLAATGEPHESGATWPKFSYQNFPNLDALSDRSDWTLPFKVNSNITDDLAVILEMLNNVAGNVLRLREGNLISITNNNTVNVRNNISDGYDGLVGIEQHENKRQLVRKDFNVQSYGTGPTLATITYDGHQYPIHKFNDIPRQFNVKFYNGNTLVQTSGPFSSSVILATIKPNVSKGSTQQYKYVFDGWYTQNEDGYKIDDYDIISYDIDLYAKFEQQLQKYTITFINYDGTVLQKEELEYGALPEYNYLNPEKPDSNDLTYDFSGWSPEITEVTGDATYTAQFTSENTNKYYVSFDPNGGIWMGDLKSNQQNPITVTTNDNSEKTAAEWFQLAGILGEGNRKNSPTYPGKIFSAWLIFDENQNRTTINVNKGGQRYYIPSGMGITILESCSFTPNKTLKAVWSIPTPTPTPTPEPEPDPEPTPDPTPDPVGVTYTIVFYGKDNNRLSSQTVESGTSVSAPTPPTIVGFTFSYWGNRSGNAVSFPYVVTSNTSIYAYYVESPTTSISSATLSNHTSGNYATVTASGVSPTGATVSGSPTTLTFTSQSDGETRTATFTASKDGYKSSTYTATVKQTYTSTPGATKSGTHTEYAKVWGSKTATIQACINWCANKGYTVTGGSWSGDDVFHQNTIAHYTVSYTYKEPATYSYGHSVTQFVKTS